MEKIRTKNGTWSAAHDVLRIKNQHISPRGPSEAWIRSIMGTNQKLSSDLSISFRHWEKPTNNYNMAHRHPPPFKYLLDPTDEGASSPIIFSSLILLYSIYVSPPSLVNSDRPQHGSPPEIWSNWRGQGIVFSPR